MVITGYNARKKKPMFFAVSSGIKLRAFYLSLCSDFICYAVLRKRVCFPAVSKKGKKRQKRGYIVINISISRENRIAGVIIIMN